MPVGDGGLDLRSLRISRLLSLFVGLLLADGFSAPTVLLVVADGKAPPRNERNPIFPGIESVTAWFPWGGRQLFGG